MWLIIFLTLSPHLLEVPPHIIDLQFFLDQALAQEQVLEILPLISEVNAISEELDKHK